MRGLEIDGFAFSAEGEKRSAVTATAPPITRSRLGSQLPVMSRKSSTLRGFAMPGEPQADAEQESGAEGGESQARAASRKVAAMPVAMKTITATSERSEKRPRPHTPWPLVQPPPMRVPKPTSRPASAAQPRCSSRCSAAWRDKGMPGKAGGDQPGDESHAPGAVARRLRKQPVQNSAHAGDAAVGGEQPHAREADQHAAGERRDWCKVLHMIFRLPL